MGRRVANTLRNGSAILGIVAALLSTGASAQDAPTASDAAGSPAAEDILVVGTRLRGTDRDSISPVVNLDAEAIALDRSTFADEIIGSLPQVAGGIGAGSGGNDAFGASVVDLRGLGQNRTLVLIDGKRGAPFGFRNSVDVSSIPIGLVQEIEVLTGGASTVYGADAVVGVVNFRLRDDFEGAEIRGGYEISDEGDGRQFNTSVIVGGALADRGNVTAYLGYTDRSEILAGQRDFASPERNDTGLVRFRPAGGTFTQGASVFSFTDAGAFTTTPQLSEFSAINTLIQPARRIDGGVLFHYEASQFATLYGRATFSNTEVSSQLDPVERTFTAAIRSDNPFLTPQIRSALTFDAAGVANVSVARSFAEFGPTVRDTNRTNIQGQFGVRGDIAPSLSYDAYVQYGRSDESNRILGDGLVSRLLQASNATVNAAGAPVCVDASNGCAPANLFGPNALSDAAVGFITVPVNRDRLREQTVAGLTLNGTSADLFELPAGPIDLVLGFEYRDETAREDNDGLVATGQTFEQGTRPSIVGGFDVAEFFAEARIPILSDLPFVQKLNFEGGYRFSDFSTSGTSHTYKLGGNWIVSDDLRLRGSFQTAIRSPNVGELFGPIASIALAPRVASGRLVDPCSNPAVTGASVTQCQLLGAPAAPFVTDVGSALFIFGGNPDLLPEEAESYTIGAVLSPRILPGLSLSVDYFDIDIDGGLFVIFPEDAARDCYVTNPVADNPLCALVPRGPNGQISLADVTDRNVSSFTINGLDVSGRYRFELGGGIWGEALTLRYAGSFVFDQTRQNSQFTPVIDCAGTFGTACAIDSNVQADYRHLASLGWNSGKLTTQVSWQHIGPVRNNGAAALVNSLSAEDYIDIAASYALTDELTLTAGIDNLLDKRPPIAGSNQENFNTFPNTYDVVGRRFGFSASYRF